MNTTWDFIATWLVMVVLLVIITALIAQNKRLKRQNEYLKQDLKKVILSGSYTKNIPLSNELADAITTEGAPTLAWLEDQISDDFGTETGRICPKCGGEMQVVRPGDIRCTDCEL